MSAASWIWLNGRLLPADEARVPALDRGLLYGDGVFETLRAYDGRLFALDRHLARLRRSLDALRLTIPESDAQLAAALTRVAEVNALGDGVLRLTVTRGAAPGPLGLPRLPSPTRMIHTRPLPRLAKEAHERGVRALLVPGGFGGCGLLAGHKSVSFLANLAARQAAAEQGCAEALLGDGCGRLIEGATSNVFLVHAGVLQTPALRSGALPGVTRALVLELAQAAGMRVVEDGTDLRELPRCEELILTSSAIEVLPITSVWDGQTEQPVGDGRPGWTYRQLRAAYRARVESDGQT